MSFNNVVADMVARVNNAQAARHSSVTTMYSGFLVSILEVLYNEGYIEAYEVVEETKGVRRVNVALRYHKGKGAISKMSVISRPGLRRYSSAKSLPKSFGGLGVIVVSTSKGVMCDRGARSQNLGGEMVISVF